MSTSCRSRRPRPEHRHGDGQGKAVHKAERHVQQANGEQRASKQELTMDTSRLVAAWAVGEGSPRRDPAAEGQRSKCAPKEPCESEKGLAKRHRRRPCPSKVWVKKKNLFEVTVTPAYTISLALPLLTSKAFSLSEPLSSLADPAMTARAVATRAPAGTAASAADTVLCASVHTWPGHRSVRSSASPSSLFGGVEGPANGESRELSPAWEKRLSVPKNGRHSAGEHSWRSYSCGRDGRAVAGAVTAP